jgi:hypothetical protein
MEINIMDMSRLLTRVSASAISLGVVPFTNAAPVSDPNPASSRPHVKIKSSIRRALLGTLMFAGGLSQAQAYSTYLNSSNANSLTNPPFAQVTINQLGGGDIEFIIDVVGTELSGQMIEQFGFNISDSTALTPGNFTFSSPTDWSADTTPTATMDGFGKFDVVVNGGTSTAHLTFTISAGGDSIATYATDGSTTQGNGQGQTSSLFAAKISSQGQGAFLAGGTPVPLPAAIWLFGSGLMGIVVVARRKRSN